MPSKKGVRKPRITEYGRPHAVRFLKDVEKDLAVFSIEHGIRVSRIIQSAVSCFLSHPDCIAKNKTVKVQP